MEQAIQKVDHVAIVVHRENLEKYVEQVSKALGIEFDEPAYVESTGVVAALSWDAGLEILAPQRNEGRYWERLQKHGEGSCIIVFGVADMDSGLERARKAGVETGGEIELGGTESWFDRFRTFREARIDLLPADFACSIALSEIDPKY